MYKKEGSGGFSTSKEQERLKKRLRTLFKEHELKQSESLKNQHKEQSQQQVNGEPPQTKQKQKVIKNKQKVKDVNISKASKKPSGPINIGKGAPKKTKPPYENGFSNNNSNSGGNNPKKKLKKLNNKQSSQPSSTSAQPPQSEKSAIPKENKKNKKRKEAPTMASSQNQKQTDIFQTQKTKNPVSNKVPLANGQQKISKNQKKKAKKRVGTADNQQANDSKKPKLIPGGGSNKVKDATKSTKKQKPQPKKRHPKVESSPGGKVDDTDFSNIRGFVKGGDFGSDHEDDPYWAQQDKDIDAEAGDEYKIPGEESGDDPYNYSDSDEDTHRDGVHSDMDDDPYDYSDFEEEEEEECYSDFDEDDYEEDEDSYDYSDSEFSSNFEDDENAEAEKSYDFNDEEEDDDYKLPENIPEDMFIHSGTATKRDILPEDNVVFKDKKYCQIIELDQQDPVKVVQQPKAYEKEELLKLTYRENHIVKVVSTKEGEETESCAASNDDCPKLVPIVDEDGFQLYNPNEEDGEYEDDESLGSENTEINSYYAEDYEDDNSMYSASLGSEYTEINSDDADSLMSEDINEKYLNRGGDDYYSSDDELLTSRNNVDVIDATACEYVGKDVVEDTDESIHDEDVSQLLSQRLFRHVKVGSKCSIICTTVVDQQELQEDEIDVNESSIDQDSNKAADILNYSDNSGINEVSTYAKETPARISNVEDEQKPKYSNELNKQPASRSKSNAQSLTNYNTLFCNAINANLVLVLLKDPFYIYGTVRLTLLAGSVEVYGHPLAVNQEVEIFSPRGCSVIEIFSKSSEDIKTCSRETLKGILKKYESNFILADLESIVKSFEMGKDAVVLLKHNEGRKKIVQQFKKFMNENVFPNLQNINMDRPLYNSEYLLRCMINTSATEQKCLRLPDQWQMLEVSEKSRVLLAGGKGVGKSTLLRYLINKHILQTERVLLIDLDIGQPEIFIPQTVSCSLVRKPLLGPGFFLNIQPEKAFVVGHTNIALCPHKYLTAVQNLIRYCLLREDFKGIPWLVNTMGYNKGFGLELMSVIVKALPLTDVIQLQSTKDINNFETMLFPHTVGQIPRNMFVEDIDSAEVKLSYRLHVWQSAVTQETRYQKEWDMSPKDMRYAMLLTRLSEALPGHADWLADCKPMSAPLDDLKLVNLMDNIPPSSKDELAKAMEANLVYLCHYENDQTSVECLGIGVVRAIDYHVRQVYLLPAMPHSLLKLVNCLALGDMPLPNSIFTNQGSRVKNTAPFVYNTIEANASKAIKQIYHRPRAFLSGKHKSLD